MNTGENPEYDKALAMALKMLRARDRLSTEIRARCLYEGISESQTNQVLEFLQKKRLTNDSEVATNLVTKWSEEKGWGPIRLQSELVKKGLDENLAEQVAGAVDLHTGLKKAMSKLTKKSADEIKRSLYRFGYSEEFIAGLDFE